MLAGRERKKRQVKRDSCFTGLTSSSPEVAKGNTRKEKEMEGGKEHPGEKNMNHTP